MFCYTVFVVSGYPIIIGSAHTFLLLLVLNVLNMLCHCLLVFAVGFEVELQLDTGLNSAVNLNQCVRCSVGTGHSEACFSLLYRYEYLFSYFTV